MREEARGQAYEGHGQEQELAVGRRPRRGHPADDPALRAGERQDALNEREPERQDQGQVTDLGDHGAEPCVFPVGDAFPKGSFLPASALATSGGM